MINNYQEKNSYILYSVTRFNNNQRYSYFKFKNNNNTIVNYIIRFKFKTTDELLLNITGKLNTAYALMAILHSITVNSWYK